MPPHRQHGPASSFCFDEPHLEKQDNAQPGAIGQTVNLCMARGHWSNVDVYIDVPDGWRFADATGVTLKLVAVVGGLEVTLAQSAVFDLALESSGDAANTRWKALAFKLRGHPCEGFILKATSPAVTPVGTGRVRMVCWGTESTPVEAGQSVFQHAIGGGIASMSFPKSMPPTVAAICLVNDESTGTLQIAPRTPAVANLSTFDTFANGSGATPPASGAYPVAAFCEGSNKADGRWDAISVSAQAATTDPRGYQNCIGIGKYVAAGRTLTDGQYDVAALSATAGQFVREELAPGYEDNSNNVAASVERPMAANTYAPSLQTNFGAATKANTKASAGNVLAVRGHNANAAGRWLLLHNKATAPAAGDAPLYAFWVGPGQQIEVTHQFFVGSGGAFSTGIGWAWSTTQATFTDGGTAADHTICIHYK